MRKSTEPVVNAAVDTFVWYLMAERIDRFLTCSFAICLSQDLPSTTFQIAIDEARGSLTTCVEIRLHVGDSDDSTWAVTPLL